MFLEYHHVEIYVTKDYDRMLHQMIHGFQYKILATSSMGYIVGSKNGNVQYILNRTRRFSETVEQGIGVLGFKTDALETIYNNYLSKHPELIHSKSVNTLEVYAYYNTKTTLLRFITYDRIPGYTYDENVNCTSPPVVFDHWVSNVFDRQQFLDILHDTLGLEPRVEFNAGIISAGEACIESTVAGNDEIYLPINNAISDVGHVYSFLQEYGQGVQHIACRVDDIVGFIEHACQNGVAFLEIPRSYYGMLPTSYKYKDILIQHGLCTDAGILNLDITFDDIEHIVPDEDIEFVLRSRYNHLYEILGDTFEEEYYIRIIKNQILVDVQGEDVLLQIFTSNLFESNSSPFFEFIQRICEKKKTNTSGCGGFGIRNFLALFLSIELRDHPEKADILTKQMEESNPILSDISESLKEIEFYKVKLDEAIKAREFHSSKLQALSEKYRK